MEYVYSALVLHAAGKTIDDDAIANVLRGAGMEPDPARIKAVTASLEGINIDEAIASAAVAPVAAAPAAARRLCRVPGLLAASHHPVADSRHQQDGDDEQHDLPETRHAENSRGTDGRRGGHNGAEHNAGP